MKQILKDNKGSTIVEAAIYFPLILIMVVVMVLIGMYKLDKMFSQACMSKVTAEQQSSQDRPERRDRQRYWNATQERADAAYLVSNSIFKWSSASERHYAYVDKSTLCPMVQAQCTAMPDTQIPYLPLGSSGHGFLLQNNPIDMMTILDDVQMICQDTVYGDALRGKTGYTYEEYLQMQFGN